MKKVYCKQDLLCLGIYHFYQGKTYNVLSYETVGGIILNEHYERINIEDEFKMRVHLLRLLPFK